MAARRCLITITIYLMQLEIDENHESNFRDNGITEVKFELIS